MSLSVVIGTYNRLEILQSCLGSLLGKIAVDHEIVVVDAGSTDGTLEFLAGLQGIRLICDEKLVGQAQSLNRVFPTLQSRYTCWLSDDNVVLDGMLDAAVMILKQNSDIGMVALKVKDVTGPYADKPYIGGIWPSGILNCNQGILRTELLWNVGGFGEEFRDYGIDADLTTKVLLAGYKVVYTKRVAIHHYRDHNNTSWIDPEDRKQRMQLMKDVYHHRYAALIHSRDNRKARIYSQLSFRMLQAIQSLYRLANRGNISLERLLGYNDRDWFNVLTCCFISNLDLVRNKHKAYYLVQKIPDDLRREVQICPS